MLKSMKNFDLKSFRKSLRLTQSVLGDMIGVSGNLISSMELGKAQMTLDTYDKLKKHFPDIDFSNFQLEAHDGMVTEPAPFFKTQGSQMLFDMYQEKDRQLTQCNEEKATLLREIIRLKDELANSKQAH
ncbi:MAG: helix-turn-helix transcriptional regulator [Chitinophagaceae bacterium]|uniref:HTH cro/C1-type domain-containing protein n=1 Tax=Rurimicrobium arvi TaxID=2049916 RepID=A0ABP8MZT2_9BACT